ncbi:dTDP-4-dehydrorhamnose 3,5-epimerase family protein [Dactylosporangium vinaceum]|uniref:dTDP-4-dehydrorhamnose 3,5-epimerase family protein n=1 Tax=Dactylosporangium vinaceum TaxID=53362 RepID=A0ABV5MIZ0_9ACTN|nr:dTDP-4-dehydrorhamnose 3,5-epimerase family protein [Dactylosporangium vinaceum]UAB93753.1 dTDP-4-dehydrorhamnose 3,5-epimerase family protein [Dactylosporangium vinaceum]
MKIRQLSIGGAWEITPVVHGDPRGLFTEIFRADHLAAEIGHPLRVAQANLSVSSRGVVRGVHFADVPPGQAKYISCIRGAVLDIVVDLRVGSPTFGLWEGVQLDDEERRAVYLGEGLGHAVCALTDDATLAYMVSETFNPTGEHTLHPLDPDLDIRWPVDEPILSARDTAAPSLAQLRAEGRLPDYATCQRYTESLRFQ